MMFSFDSSYRITSYKHYLKQKMPFCEIKLKEILYRDPSPIILLNIDLPQPLINDYDQDLI